MPDTFVHDMQTGQTTRVSIASDGTEGNGGAYASSLSADGRYVAFMSDSSNLVSGDTNLAQDIFVHDMQTGQTRLVSVSSDGTQGNVLSSADKPSLSADGRYVAFSSFADNLVSGDTNQTLDVFVHDRQTGQTTRASVASYGRQSHGGASTFPILSADGRYVAFESLASNLVSRDTNHKRDIFVRDLLHSVDCTTKPAKPILNSPVNGAGVTTTQVLLDWKNVNCTDVYKVVVRQGATTGAKIQQRNNLTVSQFTTKTLGAARTYYWQVQACNGFGCTKSTWWHFDVK